MTHMMKERRQGVEVAKCGVEVKSSRAQAPMTIWPAMVSCPDCLAKMASTPGALERKP